MIVNNQEFKIYELTLNILINHQFYINLYIQSRMAQALKQKYQQMCTAINNDLKEWAVMTKICDKVGLQPAEIVFGVVFIILIFSILGFLSHMFVTFFGLIYPSYKSFKAIRKGTDEQYKRWLTYWIVFGFFTAMDKPLSVILSFIPGYYLYKLIFYVLLFHPQTDLALHLYNSFLRTKLLQIEKRIGTNLK